MGSTMGLLGKKVGMTQVFDSKGNAIAVTAVQVGPCIVLDIKNPTRDGYTAVKLGFGNKKPHRTSKPQAGVFAKANTTPKSFVREIRLSEKETSQFEIGQTVTVDQVFQVGDSIDAVGISKGKGFQGVMKRHHFAGFGATHGTHETFRHGGSIGCRLTPGRVHKGKRMSGQMGNKRITVQNMIVSEILPDKNLVLIKGSVPGAPEDHIMLKHAVKRTAIPFMLKQTVSLPKEEKAPEPDLAPKAD